MENLKEAYKLLDEIKDIKDPDIIKDTCKKAFELSNECFEAAIILSKLTDKFEIREDILLKSLSVLKDDISKDKVNIELANLYFDYGMFKTSLDILLTIKDEEIKSLAKYKIMTLLVHFEDEKVDEYYKNNIDMNNDVDFVRMSFSYMIYKYKKHDFTQGRSLYEKICSINPYIIKIILNGINKEEDSAEIKEAYKVFRNNAILINESPYIIKFLENIC